jgi:hypothetical protein
MSASEEFNYLTVEDLRKIQALPVQKNFSINDLTRVIGNRINFLKNKGANDNHVIGNDI